MTRGERSSFNRPERQGAARGPAPGRAWCLRRPTRSATASASASNTSRLSSAEQPPSRRERVGDGLEAVQGYAARDACRSNGLSVTAASVVWPRQATGRDPDTNPKAFDPWCPLRSVTRDYSPTLLIHGDQDSDVPFEQSAPMSRELARQGVDHELETLEGRDHSGQRGVAAATSLLAKLGADDRQGLPGGSARLRALWPAHERPRLRERSALHRRQESTGPRPPP